jgi:mono/diheme cytochrome c family protein
VRLNQSKGVVMSAFKLTWFRIVGVVGLICAVMVAGAGMSLLLDRDPEVSAPDRPSSPDLIVRGEYLLRAADCAACHNAPGGHPFAGGVAFKLPFGIIYSGNITPDRETGIGDWSDDDFVRALHRGIAKNGTYLYPAFPYTSYSAMSREDAVAIKAYLFSLPPVHAPPRPNTLSFPFDQRWTMALWNLVFLDAKRFKSDPQLTAEEIRGAYLATALGHCGECHTPRNIAFAMNSRRRFAGAVIEGWRAYNVSSDPNFGIGAWSDRQISDYLKTGHAEGRGSAAGPMGEAVANSLQYLTSSDTDALVRYLRTVKPQPGEPGDEARVARIETAYADEPGPQDREDSLGKRLFAGNCAGCHLWNGEGRQTGYAALEGSRAVSDPKGANLVQALLAGANLRAVHPAAFMPPFGRGFTNTEIAAMSNYLIHRFGGKTGQVTADEVQQSRLNQN